MPGISSFGTSSGPMRPLLSLPLALRPGDLDNFYAAVADLGRHQPILHLTFRIKTEPENSYIRLEGQSEEQLGDICNQLRHKYNIECDTGPLAVVLVETIRKAALGEGKYIRQTGGRGNYGHVKVRLEPNEPGKGFEFINQIKGVVVPSQFMAPIREGIEAAAEGGILASCEVVDFKATVYDGSYHEIDSNEMAFRIAGSLAFKEATREANPVLLEPVMAVEINVPEDHTGAIIADISSRRGRILEMEHASGSQLIRAMVPLEGLCGYTHQLRSRFDDRVSFTMEFARYETRPYGRFDDGDTGIPVTRRPSGPTPRTRASSVDPDVD